MTQPSRRVTTAVTTPILDRGLTVATVKYGLTRDVPQRHQTASDLRKHWFMGPVSAPVGRNLQRGGRRFEPCWDHAPTLDVTVDHELLCTTRRRVTATCS